jgi:hypothetical protein
MGLHQTNVTVVASRKFLGRKIEDSLGQFRTSLVIDSLPNGPVAVLDCTQRAARNPTEMRIPLPEILGQAQQHANQTKIPVVVINRELQSVWTILPNRQENDPLVFPKPSYEAPDSNGRRLMPMPLNRSLGSGSPQLPESEAGPFKKPYI